MKNTLNPDQLLVDAVNAAVHWAKTGDGYFAMRNRVNEYFVASTPDKDPSLWYVNNSRKLAMHSLMTKCIMPLTPAELAKLDHEVRDIASDLPNDVVRGVHR